MRCDWYIELSGEAAQAVARGYVPALQAAVEETKFDWMDLNISQHAQALDPAPLTRDAVLERIP
jgi:hypothetical protein